MAMTRENKVKNVEFLVKEFSEMNSLVVCDFRGLKVCELENLRESASSNEIKVKVVKNKLASIALQQLKIEGLELNDTNLLVWGENAISLSKTVYNFKKEHSKIQVKCGYLDGNVVEASVVEEFSKLPDREELLSMLAYTWMGPVRNFTVGLDQLRVKKETEN